MKTSDLFTDLRLVVVEPAFEMARVLPGFETSRLERPHRTRQGRSLRGDDVKEGEIHRGRVTVRSLVLIPAEK